MSQSSNPNQLSGKAWPVALRRELGISDSAAKTNEDDDISATNATSECFSPNQLRQYIHRSYAVLSSLQRQLHRGEETYFEESHAHGNLFSGWDNIWIEAGVSGENNSSSGAGGEGILKSITTKKMPNDHRWFTSSCNVNPRGDGRVEAILARPSLADSPQSSSPTKSSASPSSCRILKKSSPSKVASSPIKRDVSRKRNANTMHPETVKNAPEPAVKKTKLNDVKAISTDGTATSSGAQTTSQTKTRCPVSTAVPFSLAASVPTNNAQLASATKPNESTKPERIASVSAVAVTSKQTKDEPASKIENKPLEVKVPDDKAEQSTNVEAETATADSTCDMKVEPALSMKHTIDSNDVAVVVHEQHSTVDDIKKQPEAVKSEGACNDTQAGVVSTSACSNTLKTSAAQSKVVPDEHTSKSLEPTALGKDIAGPAAFVDISTTLQTSASTDDHDNDSKAIQVLQPTINEVKSIDPLPPIHKSGVIVEEKAFKGVTETSASSNQSILEPGAASEKSQENAVDQNHSTEEKSRPLNNEQQSSQNQAKNEPMIKTDNKVVDLTIEDPASTANDVEKPHAETLASMSQNISETARKSNADTDPLKETADSDSDEDVTLSQIVKMKSRTLGASKAPDTTSKPTGTRTSARRRNPPR
jgi:hypothetical protein